MAALADGWFCSTLVLGARQLCGLALLSSLLRSPPPCLNKHLQLPAAAPHPATVTMEELQDDAEYADIMEDMKEECGRYGTVVQVQIPRPGPPGAPPPPGLGKVIIEFTGASRERG